MLGLLTCWRRYRVVFFVGMDSVFCGIEKFLERSMSFYVGSFVCDEHRILASVGLPGFQVGIYTPAYDDLWGEARSFHVGFLCLLLRLGH